MTLSRGLLVLTLIMSVALPQKVEAMFTNKETSEKRSDTNTNNSNDDDDDAPPTGKERATEVDPAAQAAAIEQRLAQDNRNRKRRAIEASVGLLLEDAPEQERPAIASRLGLWIQEEESLSDDERDDLEAAIKASLSAPAAAVAAESSSSSTAAAKAASAAAAPARPAFSRKGKATDLARAARDPLARRLPQTRTAPDIPTEIGAADLGATEARQSDTDLLKLLSKSINSLSRNEYNNTLRKVRDALNNANSQLHTLAETPVGRLPPELAEGLVEAGDRAGRLAAPSGRAPDAFVRSLTDPVTGINAARLEAQEFTGPMKRVVALGNLIAAAEAAAFNEDPGSKLLPALKKVSRDAMDDRTRLVAFLQETARNFPGAFATVRLPADQLGAPVSGGLNSAPLPLRYDFSSRSIRTSGTATALFKPTEVPTLEKPLRDGGLSATGVVEFPEVPSRLEHRSVATRRVAELLGQGDLVVQMEFAQLNDAKQTFGLLMSRAPGEAGIVERVEFPPDFVPFKAYLDVQARLTEVKLMADFLDRGSQPPKPQTPLVTASEPGSVNWNRADWDSHRRALEDRLLDIPIRNVGPAGQEQLVEIKQERPITDAHLKDPDLRRQLSNAQWLDLLCGQVDRHMGNLFIATDRKVPVVTLIDNDLSFGIKNDVYGLDKASSVPDFRLPPKPFTVDAEFKRAFVRLTPPRLREATRGLLTRSEQDALVQRFAMLKSYMESRAVTEVYRPTARGQNIERRWSDDPSNLFRGHDNPNRNAKTGDEYSYYSLLAALPVRPNGAAPAPGGN